MGANLFIIIAWIKFILVGTLKIVVIHKEIIVM